MMTQHGGDIRTARAQYPFPEGPLLDFSSSINPLGIPDALHTILMDSLSDLSRYPDPACTELRAHLSRHVGLPESCILPGNGASELLHLWFQTIRPRRILLLSPSFLEYERAANLFGAEIRWFALEQANGYRYSPDALRLALEDNIDACILCNPNNPTSVLTERSQLEPLLERAALSGIRMLVDETFIELTRDGRAASLCDRIPEYAGLMVLGALTKIFALPGLRIGYLLGQEKELARLRERQVPWSVNALAQRTGEVLPLSSDFFQQTRDWLVQEQEYMREQLAKLPGVAVTNPDANFLLLDFSGVEGGLSANHLQCLLAPHGLLIRNASGFPGLGPSHVRVAIRSHADNVRLIVALQCILGVLPNEEGAGYGV